MSNYEKVVKALKKVDPKKPYGTKLFDALARLTITPAVEAVCLRLDEKYVDGEFFSKGRSTIEIPSMVYNEIMVYMTQRSTTDTAYPGEWHCPGSVFRPGEDVEDVFSRLQDREFGQLAQVVGKRFVANMNNPGEARGHFLSLIYLCELAEENAGKEGLKGKWFPVNHLPAETVRHHRERIIPAAVGVLVAEKNICR